MYAFWYLRLGFCSLRFEGVWVGGSECWESIMDRRIILNWDEGQNTEADTLVVQAISFTPLPLGPLHNRHSRLSSVGSSARSCFLSLQFFFIFIFYYCHSNLLVAICQFDSCPDHFLVSSFVAFHLFPFFRPALLMHKINRPNLLAFLASFLKESDGCSSHWGAIWTRSDQLHGRIDTYLFWPPQSLPSNRLICTFLISVDK